MTLPALVMSPQIRTDKNVATASAMIARVDGFCLRFRASKHPRPAYQVFESVNPLRGPDRRRRIKLDDRTAGAAWRNTGRALHSRAARTASGFGRGDNRHRAFNPPSEAQRPARAADDVAGARDEPADQDGESAARS
jgi:hypothetical protein